MVSSFIVGHRKFSKNFTDLYVGSSVVAGNIESVRDKENRQKGESFEKPTYLTVDHLDLIEVYKGFQVLSNQATNVVYEILYDALEGEVKGILCGVREENGVAYYALVTKETKSVKKQISFYIEYVDFGLLPAIQKEIEEILNLNEEKIKETFADVKEKIYAGSFIGSTSEGLILIPFSTYKVNEVIPAYTGEEDEKIPQLEMELEELNVKIAEIEDTTSEEYKQLQERRKELLKELAKLRNRLYNPDILKAIKTKGDRLFITQKPEIRYLGENLIQTAYLYKEITAAQKGRVKGVYTVITLPVYNNLSKQLQRSYLELFLNLYLDGEIFPAELQKARQTVSVMDDVLKELLRSAEAGTKPNLTLVKERIKDNLSLRKRVEDLEKFFLSKLGENPEELQEVANFLKELKEEVEKGKRILYSPFTYNKPLNVFDIISLLQEVGLNISNLDKEGWTNLYETVENLNETLENTFKVEFAEELKLLAKYFLRHLEDKKPLHYKLKIKGEILEGFYPAPDRPLEIVDLSPNRILVNVIKSALKKLNALEKLQKVEDMEIFFEGYTARLGYTALVAFTRKVFNVVAKSYLAKVDNNKEEEIKALREFLTSNWLGEYRKPETGGKEETTEGEIIELDGFDELLAD